jgi:XTP/dITP diphosphohydrolase
LQLLLATRNRGKAREIAELLGPSFKLRTLDDLGVTGDFAETSGLIEENALAKALQAFRATGVTSLADDSGLFVDALQGAPGARSARYGKDDGERISRLLSEMSGISERTASFRCAVAVAGSSLSQVFLGACRGQIVREPRGTSGFGYDPIFVPDGFDRTFAELGVEVKNRISHRAIALLKAKEFLLRLRMHTDGS